ncbi:predicted protein [Sclerotinia sclerotiorum 1980 UF-70]|uniref:Uncharacterized protein n=1 Tax=Sclerotinia sclerotiorum (strain ATCC 18683 / 1980 / Ss-1) TaxID=665079 RepID=A7EHQ2_SCLS1|nr:predicted protein [Sclerotinia sclerotiorum 1980 UF-70]EDO02368.1 predicted protein [Sclerotinia sclerotiorum 1980 UF-70]
MSDGRAYQESIPQINAASKNNTRHADEKSQVLGNLQSISCSLRHTNHEEMEAFDE